MSLTESDPRRKRLAILLKTANGGNWIVPQIEQARARGMEVIVVIPPGQGRLATTVEDMARRDSGVHLERSPFDFVFRPNVKTLVGLRRLRALLKAQKVGAVLYHLYASALAVRFSTLGLRVTKVHMVAGPLFLESPFIRTVERALMWMDDCIISGSEFTAGKYRALGLVEKRSRVVPYGVDTQAFLPGSIDESACARRRLGLRSDSFVAVMVAYVYPPRRLVHAGKGIKGHEDLLTAWAIFHEQNPDTELLIVGGGWGVDGEAYRRALIKSVPGGLDANAITWLDTVDDVRTAYHAASVSVSPSLSENHGAALEASAMGVPCIVSDAGALSEAVNAKSGWIHRAGDPESLGSKLNLAFEAWTAGKLAEAGLEARSLMVDSFDSAESASQVIRTVEEFSVGRARSHAGLSTAEEA